MRLRFRRPSVLTVLVLAMLVLLPVLAVLQFRWLGQLSDAERERLQRNLRASTTDLTHAIDLEVARAIVGFQMDGSTLREEAWDRYAERQAAWQAATPHVPLVTEALLVDAPGTGADVRLRRWNDEARAFERAEWTQDLESIRQSLLARKRDAGEGEPLAFRPHDLVTADGSFLVLPVSPIAVPTVEDGPPRLVHVFGAVIVRLDRSYLAQHMLPALVARHLGSGESLDYHVAVVAKEGVVYESEPGDAQTLASRADISATFFGIRPDQFALMRQASASLGLPQGRDGRRNMIFSVFTRGPRDSSTAPARPGADDGSRLTLLVRHRAGSLEAAVGHARRRNLALNFGILMLMTLSVALIVVAARRAQSLARQQMEFVAGVSHELRTPVSVIGTAADNLAQGVVTDPSRVRQYGGTIQAEARRLGDTVERVLQFAGIQAGRVVGHRVPVEVGALVQEALAASRQAIEDAGADVDVAVPSGLPPLVADAAALRSAVQNLVANAVKYGGAQPRVRITARAVQARTGAAVQIEVTDEGLGIGAADLPRIFDPFYRGSEALARQIHGNGLGLSIVRSIVEAHGGRVTVTSTPGAGSTFTVHLPAATGRPESLAGVSEMRNAEAGTRG